MNDDARLFEIALRRIDSASQSAGEPSDTPLPESLELRSDLRLVRAVRDVQVPEDELRDAKARIASHLRAEMLPDTSATIADASPKSQASQPIIVARRRSARSRRITRAALAAAAILLLSCVAGWQVSDAAGSALPGSPLYSIKRGEETLALNFAWSDQRRGEVLAAVADHRLSEMREEARQHHDSLVQSLATQFDGTMHQLIALTAVMTERHEDTMIVTASLTRELNAEYATLQSARQSGDVVLAQALIITSQSETTAISNSHIHLPPSALNTPVPERNTQSTTPSDGPPSKADPTAIPTHTPPATPGGGNGNGNGNGGGNGSGNGHGHGSGGAGQSGGNPNIGGTGQGGNSGSPGKPSATPAATPSHGR